MRRNNKTRKAKARIEFKSASGSRRALTGKAAEDFADKMSRQVTSEQPKYRIDIQWSQQDECFVARVPELPGCATDGLTIEMAAARAHEAIDSYLDALDAMKKPRPVPMVERSFTGKIPLRIDPNLHRDLTAHAEKENESLNKFIEKKLRSAI